MKAKEVFALILIIVAGVGFYHFQTGKLNLSWDWDGFFMFGHEDYFFEETQTLEPPYPETLRVVNSHGDVEIQGTDKETVSFTLAKRIWRRNEAEAKEISDKLRPVVAREGDRLTLSTNREEFSKRNFETNFRVVVPRRTKAEIVNSHGRVRTVHLSAVTAGNRHGKVVVSSISGPVEVRNSHEDVDIEDVGTDCRVESSHSAVSVARVGGGVNISNRHGSIRLEDISGGAIIDSHHTEVECRNVVGRVEVANSFEKVAVSRAGSLKVQGRHSTVEAEDIGGPVEIRTSHEIVRLTDIRGSVNITGRNMAVSGKNIFGEEISISTSHENVELIEFAGKTTLWLTHGNAVLQPASIPGPLEVRGEYADITFFWPTGERHPFEARTRNGEIDWRLPDAVNYEKADGTAVVRAFLAENEKPLIFISTTYADIRIQEGGFKSDAEKRGLLL